MKLRSACVRHAASRGTRSPNSDECDVAITDAGEIGIKRAQDELQASPPLRAECWWLCGGAAAQCTPKLASSIDAVLEKSIERHNEGDRHRGRHDAENQHLMTWQGCRDFGVGAFRRLENFPEPCRVQGRADREECRRFGEKRQAWIVLRHPDDRGCVGGVRRIGQRNRNPQRALNGAGAGSALSLQARFSRR